MAQGRVKLFCVGKKGADFLSRRKFPVTQRYVGLFDKLSIPQAHAITADLVTGYQKGEFDRVEIVYNQFRSMTRQEIVIEQFLPVPAQALKGGVGGARPAVIDYIYEPSKERLLEAIVPKPLNFQIWRVLLESNAAEQAARMRTDFASIARSVAHAWLLLFRLLLTASRIKVVYRYFHNVNHF